MTIRYQGSLNTSGAFAQPNITLKAYFLLMWSSTDNMEMWKLGSRILPKMLSSFSSLSLREKMMLLKDGVTPAQGEAIGLLG